MLSLYGCLYTYITNTYTDTHRKGSREIKSRERFEIVASQILILTHSETIQRSFWFLGKINKEKLGTDTRIFRPHKCMHVLSFSHHETNSHTTESPKENVFMCVWCVFVCVLVLCCWPVHRQSQYMWTLKMYVTRIRLQKHSKRCDVAHDEGFTLQSTFFGALPRRADSENLPWSPKAQKNVDGPRSPVPEGECAVWNTRMY
jgi:hypothetical protein